eukprot:2690285-Pleurochrysis_carterae.AAC.2
MKEWWEGGGGGWRRGKKRGNGIEMGGKEWNEVMGRERGGSGQRGKEHKDSVQDKKEKGRGWS